ncbi:hypothetical protein, partial [Novosphingobium sp. 11B]
IVVTSDTDASSSGVQHLHYGTSMPSGGVHPITQIRRHPELVSGPNRPIAQFMSGQIDGAVSPSGFGTNCAMDPETSSG